MTFEQFKANVEQWQEERGIYEHGTPLAQALKAVSEVGELADAVIKGDREELKDAIGDVVICLVGVAKMTGYNIKSTGMHDVDMAIGSLSLAAMASYHVADIASNIALEPELWSVEPSIENSIAYLSCLALDNNLTLLECCESAWHEIKGRKGFLSKFGAFIKEGSE